MSDIWTRTGRIRWHVFYPSKDYQLEEEWQNADKKTEWRRVEEFYDRKNAAPQE